MLCLESCPNGGHTTTCRGRWTGLAFSIRARALTVFLLTPGLHHLHLCCICGPDNIAPCPVVLSPVLASIPRRSVDCTSEIPMTSLSGRPPETACVSSEPPPVPQSESHREPYTIIRATNAVWTRRVIRGRVQGVHRPL
ncbi:hypothetical protein L226DRAFT_73192 [Lentinus tigrinus ALCF2SS1-7]|uniref:uncharacterized protein n=1 Tax=Lentinus tigrinus ALCF2SS1-7 TaxID=1328758 RepID=UPI001165CE89|nr:hypothetical protein L226DRAFT_73192 [Lentinus tigrinus ALCF2SS1-7]